MKTFERWTFEEVEETFAIKKNILAQMNIL
jgi:hypothetical protein